jgi:hypothetical protein
MSEAAAIVQPQPRRVKAFAEFFKQYMSVSSVVAASLPVPVTSFQLIPTYAAQTKFLSVYTSLFCFLLLGYIFYSRHALARWMFRPLAKRRPRLRTLIGWLPLGLILACACFAGGYHWLLQGSIQDAMGDWVRRGVAIGSTQDVLAKTDYMDIPGAAGLAACYLAIFLTAEAAFVLMAIKEYLQDLLGLSEEELFERPPAGGASNS